MIISEKIISRSSNSINPKSFETRMANPAKFIPYCIYVTSRPSPPYGHRRVNERSRVLTYSLALPTWPAHAWEIVWKLTSHAPQTRKSPVLLESLWTCRFCRGKEGKKGKRDALPILAPSLYLRRRLPKLCVSSSPFSVSLSVSFFFHDETHEIASHSYAIKQ